ncbi:hypothetical protein COO60DRAFT_929727 [Scenedesmus sp. NREL 46B-D3]|nr:hypothetical protein COO60DRAFT_929727 [Scenedesmus sp. NREL 46B-D3]
MSMEARSEQFHTDAQRIKDKNTAKDIDKLRKFLFKNQSYRFTDREQSHLFQAIQLYVTMYTNNPEPDSPALNLVEDALKMPFTVFTTSQKKSMLKWLDRLNRSEAEADGEAAAGDEQQQQQYSVLDVTSDMAEVSGINTGSPDALDQQLVGMAAACRAFRGSRHSNEQQKRS